MFNSVMATWEAYTVVFTVVLTNGGPVSNPFAYEELAQLTIRAQVALVYGFFFCFIGTLCTCASLAEYASM